jgi:hypothetical protein
MDKEEFYIRCAKILGVDYEPFIPYSGGKRPTRWNNRSPGNGRFPNFGLIRYHSSNMIIINLKYPVIINKTMTTVEEVFDFLELITAQICDTKLQSD